MTSEKGKISYDTDLIRTKLIKINSVRRDLNPCPLEFSTKHLLTLGDYIAPKIIIENSSLSVK